LIRTRHTGKKPGAEFPCHSAVERGLFPLSAGRRDHLQVTDWTTVFATECARSDG
jgi:hypothetical protein